MPLCADPSLCLSSATSFIWLLFPGCLHPVRYLNALPTTVLLLWAHGPVHLAALLTVGDTVLGGTKMELLTSRSSRSPGV